MMYFLKNIDFKFKILFVLILFCSSTLSISAQDWNWARSIGEPAGAFGVLGMSKLSNDEIAILGYAFDSTIQIENDILDEAESNTLVFIIDIQMARLCRISW